MLDDSVSPSLSRSVRTLMLRFRSCFVPVRLELVVDSRPVGICCCLRRFWIGRKRLRDYCVKERSENSVFMEFEFYWIFVFIMFSSLFMIFFVYLRLGFLCESSGCWLESDSESLCGLPFFLLQVWFYRIRVEGKEEITSEKVTVSWIWKQKFDFYESAWIWGVNEKKRKKKKIWTLAGIFWTHWHYNTKTENKLKKE